MATRIDTDDTITEITPANGKVFHLSELQKIVGGYIEALYNDADGRIMYLNEDGKRMNLPVNLFATGLMQHKLQPGDYIVGSVVLCTKTETGDDDNQDEADEDEEVSL